MSFQERLFINISKGTHSFLSPIVDNLYYPTQVVAGLHTALLTCIFVYVLCSIYTAVKLKRSCENCLTSQREYSIKISMYKERILCFNITLLLLIFEIGFSFHVNITGFLYIFYFRQFPPNDVNISSNCSLKGDTYLADIYNTSLWYDVIYRIMFSGGRICFFLIIWFFSVSLIHLNNAARGLYRPRLILYWSIVGGIIGVVLLILIVLPWTSLFGIFIETALAQGSLLFVVFNYRRFYVAMKMRINAAFHTRNERILREQERLFRIYKHIIPLLVGVLEICTIRSMVIHNAYLWLETLGLNSCWFRVVFGIKSIISLSNATILFMAKISLWCLIIVRVLDFIFFSLNLIILVCFLLKAFLVILENNKTVKYRYTNQELVKSLISNPFTEHTE